MNVQQDRTLHPLRLLAGQEWELRRIGVLLAHLGGSDLRNRHQSLREVSLLGLLLLLELYRLEPHDREVLDEPLLNLLQPEVVRVQLCAGVLEECAIAQRLESVR